MFVSSLHALRASFRYSRCRTGGDAQHIFLRFPFLLAAPVFILSREGLDHSIPSLQYDTSYLKLAFLFFYFVHAETFFFSGGLHIGIYIYVHQYHMICVECICLFWFAAHNVFKHTWVQKKRPGTSACLLLYLFFGALVLLSCRQSMIWYLHNRLSPRKPPASSAWERTSKVSSGSVCVTAHLRRS